ncbi:MAG: hypothetical protein PHR94_05815 [Methylomonas lenta]|nr:hypothetical protein [Methylomonas lenta]
MFKFKAIVRFFIIINFSILSLYYSESFANDISVIDIKNIKVTRVSRVIYRYEYKVNITNTGNSSSNIVAIVSSNPSHTTVLDGNLSFGRVDNGESITSSDTFSVEHDRRFPFDESTLIFNFIRKDELINQRITKVNYDFDNNGIFEGVSEYEYDAEGRIKFQNYTYVDDGQQDADYESFSLEEGRQNSTTSYDYNHQGQLERLYRKTPSDSLEVLFQYENNTGLLNNHQVTIFDSSGVKIISFQTKFNYNDFRLENWEQFNSADNSAFRSSIFTYNDSNLPIKAQDSILGNIEYSWNIDKEIVSIINTGKIDFVYDDLKRLSEMKNSITPLSSSTFTDYLFKFSYNNQGLLQERTIDLDSNGSQETKVVYEWESNNCIPTYFWLHGTLPNFPYDIEVNNLIPGTGWALIPSCGNINQP